MSKAEINIKFGMKVKEIRLSKNLTQFDLGTMLDLDPKHISRIELSQVDVRLSTISRLADALEVPIRTFFDFDD